MNYNVGLHIAKILKYINNIHTYLKYRPTILFIVNRMILFSVDGVLINERLPS